MAGPLTNAMEAYEAVVKAPFARQKEQASANILSSQADQAQLAAEQKRTAAASAMAMRAKTKEIADANTDIDLSTAEGNLSFLAKVAQDPSIRNDPEKMAWVNEQKKGVEADQALSFKAKAAIVEDKQTIAFDSLNNALLSRTPEDWDAAIANAPDAKLKAQLKQVQQMHSSPEFLALKPEEQETYNRAILSKVAPLKAAAMMTNQLALEKYRQDKLAADKETALARARVDEQRVAASRDKQELKEDKKKLDQERLILGYEKELSRVMKDEPTVLGEEPGTLWGTNKVQVPNPRIAKLQADIDTLKRGTILDAVKPVVNGEEQVTAKDGKVYARPAGMSASDWEEYKLQVGK